MYLSIGGDMAVRDRADNFRLVAALTAVLA